jgi:hypothetical protein
MFRSLLLSSSLAMLAFASPARAQDDSNALDSITVTGSNVGYSDLLDTPAVSLTKPGDFLLQTIVLSNDSRDAEMRKREIHETIARLIASAGGRYVVFYVDEYRIALNRENYRVELEEDDKRPDTNLVSLQIRVGIGGDPTKAEAIIAEMRRFIRGADKIGRTEIEIKGDTALVMNKPERFRYELIDAIAKDSKRLMDAMALDCRVEIDGLNSRVEWERASAAELLLYIPYRMTISECRKSAQ